MKVKVVIGANYGDEGKGMFTDYLVKRSEKPLVVRANGGCQVGHTVIGSDGKRRIFSHLGSGTLQGCPTLYNKSSVVNPVLFFKEINGRNTGIGYRVFVSPFAQVTTPYDMMLNCFLEDNRGSSRHGSTGLGFGATLARVESGLTLPYNELDKATLKDKLRAIRLWCAAQLPISHADQRQQLFKDHIFEEFVNDCTYFASATNRWLDNFYSKYDTLIFENGQGLLLDQDYGKFPYVTRSNTGFRNIGKVMKEKGWFGSVDTEVFYISRCYTTRHGAGPLKNECDSLPGINFEDFTNVPNQYQGTIRLAPLDLQSISNVISWDMSFHPDNTRVSKVATCCDQIDVDSNVCYLDINGNKKMCKGKQFYNVLDDYFKYLSFSPDGNNISVKE